MRTIRGTAGGSAASAVAAVVALAEIAVARGLPRPAPERLLAWSLDGEAAVSGARHADNVAPCLHGGLTAIVEHDPPRAVPIPVPDGIRAVVVRPHRVIETRAARAALRPDVPLDAHVRQTMRLAGFLAGCFRGDAALAGRSLEDVVAGPQRAPAIPAFEVARRAALAAGALGFGIAGSGPSVFAWVGRGADADAVAAAVRGAFAAAGVPSDAWVGPAGGPGARVLDPARDGDG